MSEDIHFCCLDIGTSWSRIGIRENKSCIEFPTASLSIKDSKEKYFGNQAISKRKEGHLRQPIEDGIIKNWDEMEDIFNYSFDLLKTKSEESFVFLTTYPFNPKFEKEKRAELLFEKFKVNGYFSEIQAISSLYAVGKTTGLVLDIGEGGYHCIPIYEQHTSKRSRKRVFHGGKILTEELLKMLKDKYTIDKETCQEVKENLCYVAQNYKEEQALFDKYPKDFEKTFELPDKNVIKISNESFKCGEILFDPSTIGSEQKSIQASLYQSIEDFDIFARKSMYSNILLSGRSIFKGLQKRLENEMIELAPKSLSKQISVQEIKNRNESSWKGLTILSSLLKDHQSAVSKKEYEELGPTIINRKFL